MGTPGTLSILLESLSIPVRFPYRGSKLQALENKALTTAPIFTPKPPCRPQERGYNYAHEPLTHPRVSP